MSDEINKPPSNLHQALRTLVLYILCGVLGWVGVTIKQLQDASNLQNGSIIHLGDKVDSLQTITSGFAQAYPSLRSDVDALKVEVSRNAQDIHDLQQLRKMK